MQRLTGFSRFVTLILVCVALSLVLGCACTSTNCADKCPKVEKQCPKAAAKACQKACCGKCPKAAAGECPKAKGECPKAAKACQKACCAKCPKAAAGECPKAKGECPKAAKACQKACCGKCPKAEGKCPKAKGECPKAAKACQKACCAKCPKAKGSKCPKAAAGPGGFPPLPMGQEIPVADRLAEYGYVDLFDGKTLEGWTQCPPGQITAEHGVLETHGGMGMLWYKDKAFKNFTLVVEWMNLSKTANSGIFVRFPDPGQDPWVAVNNGYEIQIDDGSPDNPSGSIYSFKKATQLATKGPYQWNRYEVTVVGQEYTIVINGKKVCEFTGERGLEGFIGLQNHDENSRVRFRRVAIKKL